MCEKEKKCPTCGGLGDVPVLDRGSIGGYSSHTCFSCNGTGVVHEVDTPDFKSHEMKACPECQKRSETQVSQLASALAVNARLQKRIAFLEDIVPRILRTSEDWASFKLNLEKVRAESRELDSPEEG